MIQPRALHGLVSASLHHHSLVWFSASLYHGRPEGEVVQRWDHVGMQRKGLRHGDAVIQELGPGQGHAVQHSSGWGCGEAEKQF